MKVINQKGFTRRLQLDSPISKRISKKDDLPQKVIFLIKIIMMTTFTVFSIMMAISKIVTIIIQSIIFS